MPADAMAALSFEAPYVVERLVKDRVVESASAGAQLFAEMKKYLILVAKNRDVLVGMYSTRVDEAWHAFILHTAEYDAFCRQFFGQYMAHAPTNVARAEDLHHIQRRELTFGEFREKYEAQFVEPLPDVWYDARGITPSQRIFNNAAGNMRTARRDLSVELIGDTGDVVISVNRIAAEALEFVANTGAFYVRELPGDITDHEKVALAEALVSVGAVRLAP